MTIRQAQHKTIYVAMSGGVDSSVAALLLKRSGYRVVGVFMKPWQPAGVSCLWEQDRHDALRVAAVLDIPLLTWDFSRQYGRQVADPMVNGYRRGLTPNPDVECNRHIKFGFFYRRALREGADTVATGHYARLVTRGGRRWLAKGTDRTKDQTYFLWGLDPEQLDRLMFPIGRLHKPEVRRIAARAGLPTAAKKDSQGVCFVGALDVKDFLLQRIASRRGRILDAHGRQMGHHDGAAFYTIGQRHGLDIKAGAGPYYVLAKNMRANTVTVGSERGLYRTSARVIGMRWFGLRPSSGEKVSAVIRYQSRPVSATVSAKGHIRFLRPVKAIAPGQSVVFYQGMRLIGGGMLRSVGNLV